MPPERDTWKEAGVAKGDVIAGRYRVEDILGVGGMGAVLSTVHVQLGTRFAVKIVLPSFASQANVAERFMREARAASRLQSPNAVRILDIGRTESGAPYMVMELLEGEDLKSLIAKSGPLEPKIAAGYIVQACNAVAEAHLLGIVHRDIKPANLFLVQRGPQAGTIKVLDFGISKFLVATTPEDAAPLTNPETTLGSPKYMAPEQLVRPHEVDERADVWSLGVTLYELVVGKAPFRGPSDEYIARAVMVEYPMPPVLAKPGVPEWLSETIMRCLEKDKNARFSSAAALALALERPSIPPGMRPSAPPVAPALAHAPVADASHRSPIGLGQASNIPPPPAVPHFTSAPPPPGERVPASAVDGVARSRARLLAIGLVAIVGAAGALVIFKDRAGAHRTAPIATVDSGPAVTSSTSLALDPLPADPAPIPTDSTPLKVRSTSVDSAQQKSGPAPDPLCYAASIVCKRSYPECQPLKEYCEGKAHPPASTDAGDKPGENPICTAARIVCDHKLEECDSLTKKCLVAQMTPTP